MSLPADLSALSRAELEARLVELLGELTYPKQLVAAQRDELARLKGLLGRPSIKPSGMEKATEPKPGGKRGKRRGRGQVAPLLGGICRPFRADAAPLRADAISPTRAR